MTRRPYAAETSVSTQASRAEIKRLLERYGADAFAYMSEGTKARIAFRLQGRQVRFDVTLPNKGERRFTHHSRGPRTPENALAEWEQACRQRWRALALVIKAKLEAVAAGITTIEDEFLAATILPNKQTVGEWIDPQIVRAYTDGAMPGLLLEGPKA